MAPRRTALVAALLLCAGAACGSLAAGDASTLELTTIGRKSGAPRTATIWFVHDDAERLFVQSGRDGRTDWYLNLLKTPAVTVKIGEHTWQGQARPIADAAETARVHELFKRKYLSARVMSWFGGGFGTGKVVAIDVP